MDARTHPTDTAHAKTSISPETPPDNPEMLSIRAVCQFWGGDAPLNSASIYRQIAAGKHPKPIKVGSLSRWLRQELIAERERRMVARDSGI